jgi:hypothetical protein
MNGWNISSFFHLSPSSIYDPETGNFLKTWPKTGAKEKTTYPKSV